MFPGEVPDVNVSARRLRRQKHVTCQFGSPFRMSIRQLRIQNSADWLNNEQITSHTDGFMDDIHLNCVTWITFFLNLRMAGLYVSKLTSRVCVELGKILVICKK
jgi:hypothetical protein